MAGTFVEEDPIRTRERIVGVLNAIKDARGSSLGINKELAHDVLVKNGFSYVPIEEIKDKYAISKEGGFVVDGQELRKSDIYVLKEKRGPVLSIELVSTRYLDGFDKEGRHVRGEPLVQMVYHASASTGYINLDGIERWILKLKGEREDPNPVPSSERVQSGAA